MHFVTKHKGSTNDATVFRDSQLGADLLANKMPAPYFIVGDAAYPLLPSLLTPYWNRSDWTKGSFDFWQSHYRMNVECAFGLLQERWGIFWKELQVPTYKVPLVVRVAMKLHNLCIDLGDSQVCTALSTEQAAREAMVMQSDGCAQREDEAAHAHTRMGHNKEGRREEQRARLQLNGITRPRRT
jgi:hypothetical protein